jgi:flagellar capping protein FliD
LERQRKELESDRINEIRSQQYEIEQARTALEQKKSDLSKEEYELEEAVLEFRSLRLPSE